jgi:hypothetical protein
MLGIARVEAASTIASADVFTSGDVNGGEACVQAPIAAGSAGGVGPIRHESSV